MNKRYKIVIDARRMGSSGIGRYLRSLIPAFVSQWKNDVLLLVSRESAGEALGYQADTLALHFPIYDPREQVELSLKIPRSDIFFSPHFISPWFPIRAKKRVCTIHDVFLLESTSPLSPLKRYYARLLFQKTLSKSQAIITVSDFSASRIVAHFPRATEKIHRIYNGVDPLFFSQRNHKRKDFFLSVGNLKPHKNLVRLIQCFASRPDLHLKIAGQKKGFHHPIEGLDALMRDAPNVELLGELPDKSMKELYESAFGLIFPSLYEGFGYPLVEAMAAKLPIIASDIPIMHEIGGQSVLFCDGCANRSILEAIDTLQADPSLGARLVNAGEKQVKHFSLDRMREQHLQLFHELLA